MGRNGWVVFLCLTTFSSVLCFRHIITLIGSNYFRYLPTIYLLSTITTHIILFHRGDRTERTYTSTSALSYPLCSFCSSPVSASA